MAASGEVDLEYQLSNAYDLDFCQVVDELEDKATLKALGAAGAAFLGREIGQGTKRLIGVGYGRTLEALVDVLPEQAAPNLQLVSLMGSLTRRSSANPHEVIDHLAQRTGAQAFVMPVPFMANTAADRSVLLEQRAVAEAFALADECDLMLVGIGATDGGASLVSGGMIEPADMSEIRRLGAVGELLGHFFDIDGRPIETELSRRIVTLPVDRLQIRRIVAVAGGATKVDAIARCCQPPSERTSHRREHGSGHCRSQRRAQRRARQKDCSVSQLGASEKSATVKSAPDPAVLSQPEVLTSREFFSKVARSSRSSSSSSSFRSSRPTISRSRTS